MQIRYHTRVYIHVMVSAKTVQLTYGENYGVITCFGFGLLFCLQLCRMLYDHFFQGVVLLLRVRTMAIGHSMRSAPRTSMQHDMMVLSGDCNAYVSDHSSSVIQQRVMLVIVVVMRSAMVSSAGRCAVGGGSDKCVLQVRATTRPEVVTVRLIYQGCVFLQKMSIWRTCQNLITTVEDDKSCNTAFNAIQRCSNLCHQSLTL